MNLFPWNSFPRMIFLFFFKWIFLTEWFFPRNEFHFTEWNFLKGDTNIFLQINNFIKKKKFLYERNIVFVKTIHIYNDETWHSYTGKKIQTKKNESLDTSFDFCWHQLFSPEISKFCYIKKYRDILHFDT